MCNGFGAIVTREAIYFCEPAIEGGVSHREIIQRLGWPENSDPFIRQFVRIECSDWTMASFRFDEFDTLPAWVDEESIRAAVEQTLPRCSQAWDTYEAAHNQAWHTYFAARNQAWDAYFATTLKRTRDTYFAALNSAWETFEAAHNQARAQMVNVFALIPGYVAA